MADKNFKVKSGLNIPITSAAILTTDSSGNISSTSALAIANGGTGQTTATNAINALLPIQNGSTVNYSIQSDGTNISWAKVYNQLIQNAGTSVTPRRNINIVGGTFADDAGTDTTTITFTDNVGVSKSGGDTITASSASVIPLIAKGAASQSADLQQWQNSSGVVLASFASSGYLTLPGIISGAAGINSSASVGINISNFTSSAQLAVSTAGASYRGIVVRGVSSQSANLQEWQDSAGTIKAQINPYGGSFFADGTGVGNGGVYGAGTLSVQGYATTTKTSVFRAVASQTANITEWQNSAGTVLASINASGNLMVQDLTVNGTTTTINSTTLTVDDKNIELASITSPTDTTADGAGITIKGATDKTFNWVQSTAAFTSSEPISAPAFKSAGTAVSSNITLVSGYKYFVDTTAARTLTLPASPSLGDEIYVFDASNTALTNNITVASNSNKIQGSVQDLIIDSNAATVYLTYTGSTYGWAVS